MISDELFRKYRKILYGKIIDNSIKWGQGILIDKSPAGWTVDLREAILTPYYGNIISQLFMKWICEYKPDFIAGTTVAAGCLVSQLVIQSHIMGVPTKGLYIRKEPKEDGLQKYIEGPIKEGSTVLLVDDLKNSSDIIIKSIDILVKHRCVPIGLAVILNFQRDGEKDLKRLGIPVHHIFSLKDLNMTEPDKIENNPLFIPVWKAGFINTGQYYAPKSGTVIGDGRIFIGSDRGRFLAIHTNGILDWSFPVGETYRGIQVTPIYKDGRVYFGSYDGYTCCLKSSSGEVVWKEKWGDWVGCSSPVFIPKTNKFFIGIEYGNKGGDLCCFNGDSGELFWRFKTEEYVTCAPGIDVNTSTALVGSLDKSVYALNIDDGSLKWRFSTGGHIKGGITTDSKTGSCYFTSYDGFIYCLDIKSGEVIWKRQLGRWLYSYPSVNKDFVVLTTEADYVFCLNKKSGKIMWKRCMSSMWRMSGYATIKGDRVYVGSAGGSVFVLSLEDGSILWSFQTGGPVMAPVGIYSPSKIPLNKPLLKTGKMKKNSFNVLNNRLYYPGDGITNIFNFEATELIWSFHSFCKDIPDHKNVILASSNDGYLYCFIEPY